jgi:hypothetical protein
MQLKNWKGNKAEMKIIWSETKQKNVDFISLWSQIIKLKQNEKLLEEKQSKKMLF